MNLIRNRLVKGYKKGTETMSSINGKQWKVLPKFSVALLLGLALTSTSYAEEAQDASVSTKGGLTVKSADGKYVFKLGGRFQFDYDNFGGAFNAANNGDRGSKTYFRRALFDFYGKLDEISYFLQYDYVSSKPVLAFFKLDIYDNHTLVLGKQKQPFGYEFMASSKYLTSIERSMYSSVMIPGIDMGISLVSKPSKVNWHVGLFQEAQDAEAKEEHSLTGRVFTKLDAFDYLHLGAAATYRTLPETDFSITKDAAVNQAETKYVNSSVATAADKLHAIGLEAVFGEGRWSLQSELGMMTVSSTTGEDMSISSAYVLGSWFISDAKRTYSAKNGTYGAVKGVDRAWELVGKVGIVNGEDNNAGTNVTNLMIGTNYHYNANFRMSANLTFSNVDGDGADAVVGDEDTGNALSLRAQLFY